MSANSVLPISSIQQCFVCHKNDKTNNLISPCLCRNLYVHEKCLTNHIRDSYTAQIMTARNGETFNCTICPECNSNLCIKLKSCSWLKWIQNMFIKWQFKLVKNMFISSFGILYHSIGVILLLELFVRQIKKVVPKSWPLKKMEDGVEIKLKLGDKAISLRKIIWMITWFCRVLFLIIFSASNFVNVSQYMTKLKISIATQLKMFEIKLEIELDPSANDQ